jgi:hypothetical protein
VIPSGARGYPKKKMPIALAHVKPAGYFVRNHLCAKDVDVFHACKDGPWGATDSRDRQVKHSDRGAVDPGNYTIATDYYDRKVDRIEDVQCSGVTTSELETSFRVTARLEPSVSIEDSPSS